MDLNELGLYTGVSEYFGTFIGKEADPETLQVYAEKVKAFLTKFYSKPNTILKERLVITLGNTLELKALLPQL